MRPSRLTFIALSSLALLSACTKKHTRRGEVVECSSISLDSKGTTQCLVALYKWRLGDAQKAAEARAHELDSLKTWQDDSVWRLGATKHRRDLQSCATSDDQLKNCLLVAVWPHRQTGRPVPRAGWRHVFPRKPVGKYLGGSVRDATRDRNEHHLVAGLRQRRAVPRSVERDEQPTTVLQREMPVVIERHAVGRPVPRERDDGPRRHVAPSRCLAVAAILGLQDILPAPPVVVTVGPAVVAARLQPEHHFRRQLRTLRVVVELRPVRGELIAPVL